MKKQYTLSAPYNLNGWTGVNGPRSNWPVSRKLVATELRWARNNKVRIEKVRNGYAFLDLNYVAVTEANGH